MVIHAPSARSNAARAPLALLLLFALFWVATPSAAAEPMSLFGPAFANTPETVLQKHADDRPPTDYDSVAAWVESRQPLPQVDILGGSYWLLTHIRPTKGDASWAITLGNTWYKSATLTVLGDDGSRQVFAIDRDSTNGLLANHAVRVDLRPGHDYAILIAVSSPFFSSLPRIDVQPMAEYRVRRANVVVLVLAALGLLTGLGVFILFIGFWMGGRSYLLYGVQSLLLVLGWSFYFGLPIGWLGIDTGGLNYTAWFILLAIANAYFTITFLDLKRCAPKLRRCGQAVALLSLILLPASVFLPSLAHVFATLQISLVVTFSATSGLWALTHGVRQARFFVLAYGCVVLPGLIELPGNFGLFPDPIDNADLLTLLGSAGDAMLLALALADEVKLMAAARERYRVGMREATARASTDPLTGINNRLAFDTAFQDLFMRSAHHGLGVAAAVHIAMIDLDGLKQINDNHGHARGDTLLCETGARLARLASDDVQVFRVGGDEFAVIALGDDFNGQRLTTALTKLDDELRARNPYGDGISFGLCSAPVARRGISRSELARLVREADHAMYAHKTRRKHPWQRAGRPDSASKSSTLPV